MIQTLPTPISYGVEELCSEQAFWRLDSCTPAQVCVLLHLRGPRGLSSRAWNSGWLARRITFNNRPLSGLAEVLGLASQAGMWRVWLFKA